MTEHKLFEWLKEDIDKVDAKVDILDAKLDELLKFKWQIIGGSMVASLIIGVLFQLIIKAIGQ